MLGKYIEAAKVRIFVWIVEYARDMLLSPLAGFERKNGKLMKKQEISSAADQVLIATEFGRKMPMGE